MSENLIAIWTDLAKECEQFRAAYRTGASGTVLGSLAGQLRTTVNRIDTWRAEEDARQEQVSTR